MGGGNETTNKEPPTEVYAPQSAGKSLKRNPPIALRYIGGSLRRFLRKRAK